MHRGVERKNREAGKAFEGCRRHSAPPTHSSCWPEASAAHRCECLAPNRPLLLPRSSAPDHLQRSLAPTSSCLPVLPRANMEPPSDGNSRAGWIWLTVPCPRGTAREAPASRGHCLCPRWRPGLKTCGPRGAKRTLSSSMITTHATARWAEEATWTWTLRLGSRGMALSRPFTGGATTCCLGTPRFDAPHPPPCDLRWSRCFPFVWGPALVDIHSFGMHAPCMHADFGAFLH